MIPCKRLGIYMITISAYILGAQASNICVEEFKHNVSTTESYHISCPGEEFKIMAPQDKILKLPMTMIEINFIMYLVGKHERHLHYTNIRYGSTCLQSVECIQSLLFCVEKNEVREHCPYQSAEGVVNQHLWVTGQACGFITSCGMDILTVLCKHKWCNLKIKGEPESLIYTYIYHNNAGSIWSQGLGFLASGNKTRHVEQAVFDLTEPHTKMAYIIAYEIFTDGRSAPALDEWNQSDCWKRNHNHREKPVNCPNPSTDNTTPNTTRTVGSMEQKRPGNYQSGFISGLFVGVFIVVFLVVLFFILKWRGYTVIPCQTKCLDGDIKQGKDGNRDGIRVEDDSTSGPRDDALSNGGQGTLERAAGSDVERGVGQYEFLYMDESQPVQCPIDPDKEINKLREEEVMELTLRDSTIEEDSGIDVKSDINRGSIFITENAIYEGHDSLPSMSNSNKQQ